MTGRERAVEAVRVVAVAVDRVVGAYLEHCRRIDARDRRRRRARLLRLREADARRAARRAAR